MRLIYCMALFHNIPAEQKSTKMPATSPEGDHNEDIEKNEELRVKDVSEINGITSTVNGANSESAQNGTKRKLPSWMVEASNCDDHNTQSKRSKTEENSENVECSKNAAPSSSSNSQQCDSVPDIKTGKQTVEIQNSKQSDEPTSSAAAKATSGHNSRSDNKTNVEVKVEPDEVDDNPSTSTGVCNIADIKPAVKVEKADASSSSRESCKYGIRCYRQNPMHRIEEAHPGDHDYKRPHYPPPPDGVPDCPYGNLCYRRNPTHFQQYNHPDDTDFQQNYRNYCLRKRKQRQQQNNNNDNNDDDSDLDDYDLEDPFINDDSDLDYVPSEDEEFTEELDYDDCDKAEE